MDSLKKVSTKQEKIAEDARRLPEVSFTSIAYHMNKYWLWEAYKTTRKDGAVGIDKQTAEEYAENLKDNLLRLLEEAKSGKYHAPAVRRVYIPKGDGKGKRPIGVPTFEDKVLQRAVKMLIEPVYEQDFYDFSYGFRPGKTAHEAIKRLRDGIMGIQKCCVLDMDIRKFFDTMNQEKLKEIFKQRVKDGVICRLISKWLKAGVMENKQLRYQDEGTPQGGVISPLLSNIYLHEVLDRWYAEVVKPRLRKRGLLIRYADDAVMVFEDKKDAERVSEVLPKRFEKYGLTIHPVKTKLIEFNKPKGSVKGVKHSFDFLGFTLYWGKTRRGKWILKMKTAKERVKRSIKRIWNWCKENRHMKFREQHKELKQKVRGHYAYFGVSLNFKSMNMFWHKVKRCWFYWLNRRGNRKKKITWERFQAILEIFWIPRPRTYHLLF